MEPIVCSCESSMIEKEYISQGMTERANADLEHNISHDNPIFYQKRLSSVESNNKDKNKVLILAYSHFVKVQLEDVLLLCVTLNIRYSTSTQYHYGTRYHQPAVQAVIPYSTERKNFLEKHQIGGLSGYHRNDKLITNLSTQCRISILHCTSIIARHSPSRRNSQSIIKIHFSSGKF